MMSITGGRILRGLGPLNCAYVKDMDTDSDIDKSSTTIDILPDVLD